MKIRAELLLRASSDRPHCGRDLAALTATRKSVRIATPDFLPEPTLIAALNLAALRGVTVDIMVPGAGICGRAMGLHAPLWQVIERGCRVWHSPPPFDRSKLFIVDNAWSLIGSTNWDPRSLRLNFEFNVECYDPALARTLSSTFDAIRERSSPVTLPRWMSARCPCLLGMPLTL